LTQIAILAGCFILLVAPPQVRLVEKTRSDKVAAFILTFLFFFYLIYSNCAFLILIKPLFAFLGRKVLSLSHSVFDF